MNALLFINGTPPQKIPNLEGYACILATDGAFQYLKKSKFPLEKLDIVSGDFDSHCPDPEMLQWARKHQIEILDTPDQDYTDFHKALEILKKKGVKKIDVYGGSGKEQDHFLGNLHVAFLFRKELEITFFDEFSRYFFIKKNFRVNHIKDKTISLFPFPTAENITTKGLHWELNHQDLSLIHRVGTRNVAQEDSVHISYEKGHLLIFIGR